MKIFVTKNWWQNKTFRHLISSNKKNYKLKIIGDKFILFLNIMFGDENIGSVWIELIVAETENWKHCSKIILKCMNSVVGPVNSTWTVCEQCFLSPAQ